MNRDALRYAIRMVGLYVGVSAAGGFAIWVAIWLPTWMLMRFAGWAFIDAYLTGLPIGIISLCMVGIGVMSYRHKVREP